MTAPICRDLDALVPSFRARVVKLLARMKARGYDVQVWETYRSPERIALLAARGTGSARSMHAYGVAADIVENDKSPWVANVPGLWQALGEEAEALGLTWGGRWRRRDFPHVQAIPVAKQNAVRAATVADAIDALAAKSMGT